MIFCLTNYQAFIKIAAWWGIAWEKILRREGVSEGIQGMGPGKIIRKGGFI
jgi:hypothetical protein